MKVFIPSDLKHNVGKKTLFFPVQQFYSKNGWKSNKNNNDKLCNNDMLLVNKIKNADVMLIPYSINFYFSNNLHDFLEQYDIICQKEKIRAYCYISGDFSISFKNFKTFIYYRMGGFKSKLNSQHKALPALLSDRQHLYFKKNENRIREKKKAPKIGFCGYATNNKIENFKQIIKYLIENSRRFIRDPLSSDYEKFFISGYERYKILKSLESSLIINTNIIYRNKYRAGAKNTYELKKTTYEYYDNIKKSDYVICIRGSGNFSIRLYETLMMGRIPIFINTDCLLPFLGSINWKKHTVWIEWGNIHNLENIIYEYHNNLSAREFKLKQIENRLLWEQKLSPLGILNYLK